MENSTPTAETPPTAPPAKNTWDTVLTTTPVILTVLGTLLAGLSSSEMTLAQYFRSLAAQSQSKAGDQWGFFQAKRIRGQTQEATLDLLPVLSRLGTVSPPTIQAGADRLVQRLQRSGRDAERLQLAVGKASANLGKAADPLGKATAALMTTTAEASQQDEAARGALIVELAKPGVKAAFAYLGTTLLPETKEERLDPQLEELLHAVAERTPEREIVPVVLRLPREAIQNAIETAETNTRHFEEASAPVAAALAALGRAVKAATMPVLPVHRTVLDVDAALADVPDAKELADVRTAAAAVARDDAALRHAAEELVTELKMVRLDYEARRYRREADYNRRVAGLYEIQVRQLSAASERHRDRSKKFFYGMLCAQAGVVIASMALAARLQSVLWSLAGVAGLVALLFSTYVYIYH